MNRRFFAIVIPFLSALVLTGCGSNNSEMGMGGGDTAFVAPGDVSQMDKGVGALSETSSVTTPAIIRYADMSISTGEVETAFTEVKQVIEDSSGRIESSSYYQPTDGFGPSAFITARVPEAKLDELIAAVSKLGKQKSLNINSNDVTLQTIDLKAKVDALTVSRDRLQELLDQATSTADLIAAEAALAARQSELDSYQSQLEYLESQVAESTLNIQILDDSTSLTNGLRGFEQTLIQTAQKFLQAFENVVIFIGTAIPWILVFSLLFLITRKIRSLLKRR